MPKPTAHLKDLLTLADRFSLSVTKKSDQESNPWIQVSFTNNTGTFITVFNGKIVAHAKLPIPDEFQKEILDRSDNHHLWEITV